MTQHGLPSTSPAPQPSARIYIWYPQSRPGADSFGHCSMHIGAAQRVDDRAAYVSWWPNGVLAKQTLVPGLGRCASYQVDVRAEDSEPHVVYEVYGLDVAAMQAEWTRIVQEDLGFTHTAFGAGWVNMVARNCSTIVARVLQAGRAVHQIAHWSDRVQFSWPCRIWTPKAVAHLCDCIVASHAGDAQRASVRRVSPNCPSRRDGTWGSLLAGTRSDFENVGGLPRYAER